MSRTTVTLKHGWKIGDETHDSVVIRRPTTGDMLDAGSAAERVVATPAGFALVQSPARAGIELLIRQIESIGTIENVSATEQMLRALDPDDLDALQDAADALASADLESSAARGRGSAAPA